MTATAGAERRLTRDPRLLAGGLAPTDWFLVLMRLVQGVAAAFAFPLSLAVVTNAFPQAKVAPSASA